MKAKLDEAGSVNPLGDLLLEASGVLGSAYQTWIDNASNSSEEFWQKVFDSTPACLMPVLSAKPYILQGKAYVGGKSFTNKGGNVLDFIAFYRSNVACVEIKTPTAELMGSQYRENSYLPGKELVGGVAQVLESRRSLLSEFNGLSRSSSTGDQRVAYDPTCYLVIGNSQDLDRKKVGSFELYRRNLRDVAVFTYDEVFDGIKILLDASGKSQFP
ncbi:Shedu immune nuclease family protein [Amycolatopsis sp. MEPSY49]|uniref:Shedu immune nuclease family protein n=1 Tax=Amycolatopsis sp. MEPSY49 TaxID=3151600 RepID=UPI003EF6D26B